MTIRLPTEDHAKWHGFAHYGRTYSRLAEQYNGLTGENVPVYRTDVFPSWGDVVWIQAKNYFEQFYSDVSLLAAALSDYVDGGMVSRSEIHDLVSANLRRVVFDIPANELQVQNAVETLFVGRGYQKGADYDRETGRVKYSGKEYVPDFIFRSYGMAIEVKLVREKSKISRCVEEMSADVSAYLSEYENLLFVVYDLGAIQDVAEFQLSFHQHAGVRVCVVKH